MPPPTPSSSMMRRRLLLGAGRAVLPASLGQVALERAVVVRLPSDFGGLSGMALAAPASAATLRGRSERSRAPGPLGPG